VGSLRHVPKAGRFDFEVHDPAVGITVLDRRPPKGTTSTFDLDCEGVRIVKHFRVCAALAAFHQLHARDLGLLRPVGKARQSNVTRRSGISNRRARRSESWSNWCKLARHVIVNPMVFSTLIGIVWSAFGVPVPGPVGSYLRILADALTACALFAIGLGLSIDGLLANFGRSALLTIVKLFVMPLIVLGLSLAVQLDPLYTVAAVICAGVPTAKTVYILAGEYRCEESLVAATVSMTTLGSVATLILWMYALAEFAPPGVVHQH
jgi:predicted permease